MHTRTSPVHLAHYSTPMVLTKLQLVKNCTRSVKIPSFHSTSVNKYVRVTVAFKVRVIVRMC